MHPPDRLRRGLTAGRSSLALVLCCHCPARAETLPVVTTSSSSRSRRRSTGSSRHSTCSASPCPAPTRTGSTRAPAIDRPGRGGPGDPGGARPALPDRDRRSIPRAGSRRSRARPRRRLMQHGWRVFLVKVHNEAGVTAELAADEPQRRPALQARRPAAPSRSRRSRPSEVPQRWMDVAVFRDRPLKPTLSGLALEYRAHPDLQPRRRPARGEDQLRRRPGDAGPRLPQRRRHPLHVRAGRARRPGRPRRGRPADDGLVPLPRRAGPRLPVAEPPARARLLLPPPDLPAERRDRAPAAGDVHGRVHPRAGVPDAEARRSPSPQAQSAPRVVHAQALGPPGQA